MLECVSFSSGRGSAWLEHLVRDQGVGGSNHLAPMKQGSLVSVRYSDGAGVCYFGLESSGGATEGTQLLGRDSLHCCLDGLVFRVNVPLCNRNVAVAGALQTGAGVLAMIVDHVRLTEGLTAGLVILGGI